MEIQVMAVPYDTARRDFRMGAGPARLLELGLTGALRAAGHTVHGEWIEPEPDPAPAEIRTAFDISRALAARVRAAVDAGRLPVVLAGNCNTAVGTLAGLGGEAPGVLWFDAHGDFNTPETTTGGFLDGMALATVTGRCWTRLAATIPGFQPVPERNVALLGTRDLDPPEAELLARSGVTVLDPPGMRAELDRTLAALRTRVPEVYVHLDLDVLDPTHSRANALAPDGGLGPDELRAALRSVAERFHVRAVALTAYDPACDPEGRVCDAASALLCALLDGAAAPRPATVTRPLAQDGWPVEPARVPYQFRGGDDPMRSPRPPQP